MILVAIAFLCFAVILPKLTLLDLPGSSVGIRIEDLLILLLALSLSWQLVRGRARILWSDFLTRWWGLWLVWSLLTLLVGAVVMHTVTPVWLGLLYVGRYIQFFVIFLFFRLLHWNEQSLKKLLQMLGISSLAVIVYGLLQLGDWVPYFSTLQSLTSYDGTVSFAQTGVIMGTFGGHYDFGLFTVMVLALLPAFIGAWMTGMVHPLRARVAGTFFATTALAALLFAKSRSAYLSALVALAGYGWRRKRNLLLVLSGSIFLILVVLFFSGKLGNNPTAVEAGGLHFFIDFGNLERLAKWADVLNRGPVTLLIGKGASSEGSAVDGFYIRLIGETGLIGLGIFLWGMAGLGKRLFARLKSAPVALTFRFREGVYLVWLAVVTQALFIDTFVSSKVMILFWALVGVVQALDPNDKSVGSSTTST